MGLPIRFTRLELAGALGDLGTLLVMVLSADQISASTLLIALILAAVGLIGAMDFIDYHFPWPCTIYPFRYLRLKWNPHS